jgi:hypothetical protein
VSLVSPTLADAVRRYEASRRAAGEVVAGLSEDTFHRAPYARGWSVAQCLEHLVVTDGKMVERLEAAIARARAEGRLAAPAAASSPARLGWFDRLFIAGTGPGSGGRTSPPMKTSTGAAFDPGDPAARGRTRGLVLADYLAVLGRLTAAARAADGLDLARIKVPSLLAPWARVSLAGWFLALAGHHERHLDQARRARAAVTEGAGVGAA